MIYVALLRGINVGGKNKIPMGDLKHTFKKLELQSVTTYINSGNVIFADHTCPQKELEDRLNQAIMTDFQLDIPVMIRDQKEYEKLMEKLPVHWKNDGHMKCDVLFLSDAVDQEAIMKQLTVKPGIDTVIVAPGAILWNVDRKNVSKSGLMKIVGTELYKQMTIRNVNTARKIYEIMNRMQT